MPRITTDHLDTSRDEADFATWWFAEGSGIDPLAGDDMEDHAKRVARLAWMSRARRARQHG
jgi:hypothetical protein